LHSDRRLRLLEYQIQGRVPAGRELRQFNFLRPVKYAAQLVTAEGVGRQILARLQAQPKSIPQAFNGKWFDWAQLFPKNFVGLLPLAVNIDDAVYSLLKDSGASISDVSAL
jgi:hypothetical protein